MVGTPHLATGAALPYHGAPDPSLSSLGDATGDPTPVTDASARRSVVVPASGSCFDRRSFDRWSKLRILTVQRVTGSAARQLPNIDVAPAGSIIGKRTHDTVGLGRSTHLVANCVLVAHWTRSAVPNAAESVGLILRLYEGPADGVHEYAHALSRSPGR